jgi:hypothetical protein
MLEPGTHVTFEQDHGFVLSCFNDSIHMDEELAIRVVQFIADNLVNGNTIILVKQQALTPTKSIS